MNHKNIEYLRITKISYEHNKLKGIKKNPQNNPKLLFASSFVIIWRLLLCIQSLETKLTKKNIEKQNEPGNKSGVKGKRYLFIPAS